MKFFAVFAVFMAVASAMPVSSVWSLQQIDDALQNPYTNPALIPYLTHALDTIMYALISGYQAEYVAIYLPPEIAALPQIVPKPAQYAGPSELNPIDIIAASAIDYNTVDILSPDSSNPAFGPEIPA